jgi:hypothetical protein
MAFYKNVASQKIVIYAYDTDNSVPKIDDQDNITAYLSKDGGAAVQTDDVNPTQLDSTNMKGLYVFDMTQAESNADMLSLSAVSTTSDITIEPVVIFTTPGSNAGVNANTVTIAAAAITSILTTAQVESYSAKGAAPTAYQALLEILSELREFGISSTTITNKKLDGSTTAYTSTINDATNPTTKTRAT